MNLGVCLRRLGVVCIGLPLALLAMPSTAADHIVSISGNSFVPDELTVAVGDTVTFRNPSGGLHNAVSDPGAANSFRCANGCDATGGNGAPSAANWTATVTMTSPGSTPYHCAIHGSPGAGMSGLITVTGTAAPPPAARDDFYRFRIGDPTQTLDVLDNDIFSGPSLSGGSLTIVQGPSQGLASVVDGGNPATAADDTVHYSIPAGGPTDTSLRYRICNGSGGCDEGEARILARALLPLSIVLPADAGFHDEPISNLPALSGARFEASELVIPVGGQGVAVPDPTPATPWDSGRAGTQVVTLDLPAEDDGSPQSWTVIANTTVDGASTDVDLFIGLDVNRDGLPSADELRCTSAMSATGNEDCEFSFDHAGLVDPRFWVMAQNVSANNTIVNFNLAGVPNRNEPAGAPEFSATGPGHLGAGETSVVRIAANDPTLVSGSRLATILVRPQPGLSYGRSPVRITRTAGPAVGRALVSGRDQQLYVESGTAHEHLYVDVPAFATSLTVTTTSSANFDLFLAPGAAGPGPAIAPAPARSQAVASATTASGNESLVITPPLLTAGRWYVTPVNASGEVWDVVVRATVSAAPPAVRSGSYFNPDRSGHGLFLYPAGGGTVWTVLWYHYFEDGSPTWYYLEAAAPGANGIWTSGIYRSAWDGLSNHLTQVGEATLTPSGPDAFTWSWTLDGRSGSEPLAALGRGCPTVDGIERDSSSTWFDPATAGTGYSVQLFPNGYEYNAAFVYDGQGRPRYLAAERPLPGAAVATYDVEQLTGFCPVCTRTGAPARQTIGTYTRTFAAGKLTRIEVDAIYADGIPGAWTGDDTVQPLGGAETVQGCDL